MKLIGYIRISSESQADNTSLSEQRKKIEAYCAAHDYELVSIYQEIVSGKNIEARLEFQKALEDFKNFADGLIAVRLDRIARNTRELLTLADTIFIPMKKALILMDLKVDTSRPTGYLMLTMLGGIATFERQLINERMNEGRKAKVAAGEYCYGAPKFGQVVNAKKLQDCPEEQKIIDLIRRHHKSGKSFSKIAKYLNCQNIPSKLNKGWTPMQVKRIVDRVYGRSA